MFGACFVIILLTNYAFERVAIRGLQKRLLCTDRYLIHMAAVQGGSVLHEWRDS